MVKINEELERSIKGGEAITIATVCAIMAIAVLTIVVWKLYSQSKGSVTIPGGFKFTWSAIKTSFSNLLN